MRFLKRSTRSTPKVSIILLDWSVRESFHLLSYLRRQTIRREEFEVILVEYYSRVSDAATTFGDEIDSWILLDVPEQCYYHKHLMYNAGLAVASGAICVFCDSDAMVKPTFVESIVAAFEQSPNLVLHLDQFRNIRRDLYPFRFPDFDDVLGPGCINNVNGQTRGLAQPVDPLHERNYGACMCARRADLIAIGGADEHLDYLGHICGPYEMTFRLVNNGRREFWHPREFMFHTWHPGQAGVGNYLGPHDGRHMSTTALEALTTGRLRPYVENAAIAALGGGAAPADVEALIVSQARVPSWMIEGVSRRSASQVRRTVLYRGFKITPDADGCVGELLLNDVLEQPLVEPLRGSSADDVRAQIDRIIGRRIRVIGASGSAYIMGARVLGELHRVIRFWGRWMKRLPHRLRDGVAARIRKLTARVHQFGDERKFLSGAFGSLLVSLHFIGEVRRLPLAGSNRPVVLVDRPAAATFLRLAVKASLFGPVDVVYLQSQEALEQWSEAVAQSQGGYIIVARDLYLRNYGVLSRLRSLRRLVVA